MNTSIPSFVLRVRLQQKRGLISEIGMEEMITNACFDIKAFSITVFNVGLGMFVP
jgi:hypothetical protein